MERTTIGLIIDELYGMGSYQNDIWKGVKEAADINDVNLICFAGGTLEYSPYNKYEKYSFFYIVIIYVYH